MMHVLIQDYPQKDSGNYYLTPYVLSTRRVYP